jgi:hypothetical protein
LGFYDDINIWVMDHLWVFLSERGLMVTIQRRVDIGPRLRTAVLTLGKSLATTYSHYYSSYAPRDHICVGDGRK